MRMIWNVVVIIILIEIAGELIDDKFKQYYILVTKLIIISLIFSTILDRNYEKNGKLSQKMEFQMKKSLQNYDEKWFQDKSYGIMQEINNCYDEIENEENLEMEKS